MNSLLTSATLLAAASFLTATPLNAQQSVNDPAPTEVPAGSVEQAPPPKLIIAISVDQFSADLFAEYRSLFTGGLARLAGGVVFPAGYQAHGATETCPGHSTILTGSLPAHTGIIANNWFDLSLAREDKRVYCSEDPTVAGSSSASGRYSASNQYLRVPTLGDRMIAADARSQVVSIAGKDRAAIMMGGRQATETWWVAPTGLVSYPGVTPSETVTQISAAIVNAIGTARPPLELPQQCVARDISIPVTPTRSVGTGRFGRPAGNFRAFQVSPEYDGAVLAAGAAMRAQRHMGEGESTDLLILGLSATDYVGHTFGTEGTEMCLQMLALDRDLGDFFARMDATGIDYAVVLTADHGGHDLPERNRQNAAEGAQRVDPALNPDALGARIAAELGLTVQGPLLYGDGAFGDFYVSRSVTAAQKEAVIAAVERILGAHPQVDRVVRASVLAAMPVPTRSPELWTVEQRLRASFDATRSGDFLVVLKSQVTPIADPGAGSVATHGSVWDYDRRVPILFWRGGLRAFEQPNSAMTIDILPTLAGLLHLPIAAGTIDGRCLDIIAGSGTNCPTP